MTLSGQLPWVKAAVKRTELDFIFFLISALNSSAAYLESINQSLDSYNYDNKAVADIIMDNVQKVKFEGISVRLAHNLPDVRNIVCRAPWPSARTLGTGWR